MTRREKTEFILDQVELCIDNNDWAQAAILSRKINTKYFARKPKKSAEQLEKERKEQAEAAEEDKPKEKSEKKKGKGGTAGDEDETMGDTAKAGEDDVTDLKLRYYEQQVLLAKHDDKYLDVCKHYRQILDTEAIEQDPKLLRQVCSIYRLEAHPLGTSLSLTSLFLPAANLTWPDIR